MKEESFTPGQVGAILEAMDTKISLIAEAVAPIPEKLEKIEDRLGTLETDVRFIKDVIRIEIPSMRSRIDKIETRVGK